VVALGHFVAEKLALLLAIPPDQAKAVRRLLHRLSLRRQPQLDKVRSDTAENSS
jgi:hypothetical protein